MGSNKMKSKGVIPVMIVLTIIVLIFMTIYITVSMNLAKSIAMPEVLTLAEEEAWEKEHNMWGDFDSYEKNDYVVKGHNNYVLNVQLIKASEKSDKYVIISHGFRSNRNGAVKYVDVYRELGYNCIIYDVRGHGANEKTVCTLGNLESEDLYKLIEDTYNRYGSTIHLGLHGESMGSAITISTLEKKPKIEFVVADCGFTNLYQLMQDLYVDSDVSFMIYGVNSITKIKYGFDMKDTDPLKGLASNEIPICFIHGEDDTFIVSENSAYMYEANKGIDELHIIKGAEHANSREILGVDKYSNIVKQFISNIR